MAVKTKIAGLVMAVMALSAPLVYADNSGDDKDFHQDGAWHHGDGDHLLAKVLNLNEDQVKQLKDIKKKEWEATKSVFGQIKTNREVFDAEIVKAAADTNKISDLENQLKTIQAQIEDNHLNSILAIKKVLTPEQFAGYVALQKERKIKGFKHHQWGKKGESCKLGDGHKADKDRDDQE